MLVAKGNDVDVIETLYLDGKPIHTVIRLPFDQMVAFVSLNTEGK
jgi:hypothetical protein